VNIWTFSIPDSPIPLKRARASKGRFYDSQYDVKQRLAAYVKEHIEPKLDKPLEGALSVGISFYFAMPKSWSAKKKSAMNMKYHTQKPDLTNLVKMLEDALNGVIWQDDSQISELMVKKRWGVEGCTEVSIYVD
jgi:Holliday junction resolvase RusA-like endonuclease